MCDANRMVESYEALYRQQIELGRPVPRDGRAAMHLVPPSSPESLRAMLHG